MQAAQNLTHHRRVVLLIVGCIGSSVSMADVSIPGRDHRASLSSTQAEVLFDSRELGKAVLAERIEGTDRFIDDELASMPPERASPEGEVSLNFENTPVVAVVQTILGELLQENYTIAPGVEGTVTFATAKPVSSDQALSILEMLLAWNNAGITLQEGHYLVAPVANIVRGNLLPRMGPRHAAGHEARAVPLRYVAASEMETWLQPFVREGSILRADNSRQLLILAGSSHELTNYLRIIETLDVDYLAGMSMGLFHLERVDAKDVVPELEAVFGDQSSPLAGMLRVLPIERLNALLVVTPRKHYLAEAERWIRRLDRAGGGDHRAQLYVYAVRNVGAADLADRLNEIFTGQVAPRRERTDRGRVARGLRGTELGSRGDAPVEEPPAPESSTPSGTSGDGRGILGDQEARITAIEDSNSLLIQAAPATFDIIKRAIDRLDVQPKQVLIEARVLEVTLTNNLRFGVEWYLENGIAQAPGLSRPSTTGTGADANTGTTRNPNRQIWGSIGGIVTQAGTVYQFDGPDVRAFVNLLQSESDVNILSSPSVLVLNNKQAQINVGQQIPIQIGGIGSLGDGLGNPGSGLINQQFTQYRDTGVTLAVTPRVNAGGLVYMEIEQEQSTPGNMPAGGGNPPINRKLISTEVAIQSGQTVMLGGLIQRIEDRSNAGVPGLKNIPLLGRLFGASAKLTDRTETIVLITPTVIEGGGTEIIELTEEYQRRLDGLGDLLREQQRPAEAFPPGS